MGDNPYGLLLDAIAIGVSLISLGVSAWIAFRINREQLAAAGQTTFAEATADHYDRICDRYTRLNAEVEEVVAFAVQIEREQGIKTGADLSDYMTRSTTIAASVMQLTTELQILERNFQLHSNIIGYTPDVPKAVARITALEQVAKDAHKKMSFPPALAGLANKMIAGQSVWDQAWADATAAWAKGALEVHISVINTRTQMNSEFNAFTLFAEQRNNVLAKAAKP